MPPSVVFEQFVDVEKNLRKAFTIEKKILPLKKKIEDCFFEVVRKLSHLSWILRQVNDNRENPALPAVDLYPYIGGYSPAELKYF